MVICSFINFGYGVHNIIDIESNKPEKIRAFKKMNSYARTNVKGNT